MKPDAAIFQIALNRAGVTAREAVFVDDFLVNVEAARDLGMAAVRFVTPEQTLAELASLTGVQPEPPAE